MVGGSCLFQTGNDLTVVIHLQQHCSSAWKPVQLKEPDLSTPYSSRVTYLYIRKLDALVAAVLPPEQAHAMRRASAALSWQHSHTVMSSSQMPCHAGQAVGRPGPHQ